MSRMAPSDSSLYVVVVRMLSIKCLSAVSRSCIRNLDTSVNSLALSDDKILLMLSIRCFAAKTSKRFPKDETGNWRRSPQWA